MKINVYSDGGARGNPGPAAYGFVIYKDSEKIAQHCEFIGTATNNIAEYTGVLKALEYLSEFSNCDSIEIFVDSLLVQKQMTGDYKIKNSNLKDLSEKIKSLEQVCKNVTYTHIPREKNKEADQLVNKALDEYHTQH